MEVHTFLLHLLIILLSARLFAELAARLQMPPVIGELFAGVLLGPSLLGWISPSEAIKLLAEIGIILLLFEVGLDTDLRRLIRTGLKSFLTAIIGFVAPLLLGFSLSYWLFDLPLLVSLFIGGTLTATSIGITVRVLTDLKRQHKLEGQIVLGAAVVDDILGVILLAMLYDFSLAGDLNIMNAGKVLTFIIAFFFIAPVAAKLLSIVISRLDDKSDIPGLIPTMIVSLVLFFAWVAHIIGAPELLGGFAAGLALSRHFFLPFGVVLHNNRKFSRRIVSEMRPIIHLFTPIFFVMVGLSLSLHEINWGSSFIWLFSLSMLLAAIVGKLLGAFVLKVPIHMRWMIGTAMIPRGEVGLVFAELGRVSGILNNEVYAGMIIVIALTTLLPPFIMKWYYGRYRNEISAIDEN